MQLRATARLLQRGPGAGVGLSLSQLQEAHGQRLCLECKLSIRRGEDRGQHHSYARQTGSGRTNVYHFCPTCGSTVFYDVEMRPGMISIPAGAFADPDFPPPTVELFEVRRADWCSIELA